MTKIILRRWQKSLSRSGILWLSLLLFSLFVPLKAPAHLCGPTVRIVRPGDLFYYYILSDVVEFSPSDYYLIAVTNSSIASAYPVTPFSAYYYGEFEMEALQEGQTDASFHWAYVPFAAQGICHLHIIVTNNVLLASANYPQSALTGDPVNAFTGALVISEPPDLDLGGPMPLQFRRVHDSALDGSLLIRSPLGINWAHNFDTRVIRVGNRMDMVTFQGMRAQFLKSNNVWQAINSAGKSFEVIESVNGGNTNLVLGDRRANAIYTFDSMGQFISIADGKGNVHTLTYSNNSLVQISDGLGRVLTVHNTGFQQLQNVSDGTRTVQFTYSPDPSVPQLLTVTDPLSKVTTYTYDASTGIPGLLASRTLPRGNTPFTQAYDALGRVIRQVEIGLRTNKFSYGSGTTSITNPLGTARTYAHNTNGQLTAYTDESAQTVAITVNTNGQRSAITDRSSNKTGFAYDATTGKVSAVTNATGGVTFFTYTNYIVSGLTFYVLSSVIYPDASTEKYSYDAVGNVISRTDRDGNVWTYTYNNHGQSLTVRNPRGGTTTLTYNADATLASSRDSDLGTTTYVYDSLRRLVRINHPDASSTIAQFDANDRIISITDERNKTYNYYYDANGNVTNIVDPNSGVLKYAYDGMDRLITETDRLGHSQSATYDALDRLASFTDKNGFTTSIGYDTRGRMNAVTNPAANVWKLGTTAEGIGNSITNPLAQVYSKRIDPDGYVSGNTNPLNHASSVVRNASHQVTDFSDELNNNTHFSYNMGWLSAETRPRIGAVSFSRNSLELIEQYTDFNGQKWSYGYTDMGRPKSFSDPLMWASLYGYDSRGRNTSATFADGVTRSSTFDPAGNLMNVHYSDGTDYTYDYDALNRPVSGKWIALGLDLEGRPTNTSSWGVNFGASYDSGGRISNATWDVNFKVDYYYDSLNRLMMASNGFYGAWVRFGYDAADKVTSITRANGVNATYTRDNAGSITRIQEGSFIDLQYTLNALGKATQIQYTAPLDPAKFALPASVNYSYNAGSQISNPGFNYDWQGRLHMGGGHTYQWNGASELVGVDNITYAYDGWNELAQRIDATADTRYYYNHAFGRDKLAGEYNATTSQYTRYDVFAKNGPWLFSVSPLSGAVSYPHYDRNGSTLALTDQLGKITDAYAYSVSGKMISHTGSITQPYTFLGAHGVRYDSGADLYKIGARYYSATLGSFLSPDLSWPHLNNPQSTPYSFANNDPLDNFNSGGFDARPVSKKFFGRGLLDDEPRVPVRDLFPVQKPGRFSIGGFLRNYDSPQKIYGDLFSEALRDSEFSGILGDSYGGGDCCCFDCCCWDCCCYDCCCCDCCCDGPGYSGGLSILSYVRSGIYSPVRATSFTRAIALNEAYRKFQPIRVVPRSWSYMPMGNSLPGMLSTGRASAAVGDFRQNRNFNEFNFRMISRQY
jgi:RHS repeat-associated protein